MVVIHLPDLILVIMLLIIPVLLLLKQTTKRLIVKIPEPDLEAIT
jgi:hypothetical protein